LTTTLFGTQTPVLWQTLVTLSSSNVSLTAALACTLVTSIVTNCSKGVTCTKFTAIRIILSHVPVATAACIAAPTLDIALTDTAASLQTSCQVSAGFTLTTMLGSNRITVTGLADSRIPDITVRILVVERLALLTVLALSVMLALITHTSCLVTRGHKHSSIKVTPCCMPIAVTLSASLGLSSSCWLPWQIIVEVLATLTVETLGVMRALTLAKHHIRIVSLTIEWQTTRGVTIAGAGTTHYHIIHGVIVLLFDLISIVQQVVS